jgi:GNAT superfamily N-acetyltransferase
MKKGAKRVHRLVVLPDYQGIGIGTKFIKEVAKIVKQDGFELNLTTTTPSLVGALRRDPGWILARYGRTKGMGWVDAKNPQKQLAGASSEKRITYSFWYKD